MRLVWSTSLILLVCIFQNAILVAGDQVPLQSAQYASGQPPLLDNEFAAWIEETGKIWGMKGLAIAVTRKNKEGQGWTTETKGYGIADRWGNPVDEESLFSIASNSKLFAALAVGMLTSNESIPLEWESKIRDILPHSVWALQDKIAEEHANLVDILSHRTGLPRHDLSYGDDETVESSVAKLRYLRPSAEFRESWQYNNQMYILATHIVSQLSATPFAEYVMRNIISPLGLPSTTYNVTQAGESGRFVDGFVYTGKDGERGDGCSKIRFRPTRYWDWERSGDLNAGPGGVISSAKDLATWLQALLLSGRSPETDDIVIPAAVVERVAQGITVVEPRASFPELSPKVYGMGQRRYTYQGHELIEHSGGVPGYHSILTRSPRDYFAIVVLTNWDYGAYFMEVVKYRLLENALGLKEVNWNERYRKMAEEATAAIDEKKTPPPVTHAPTLPYYDLAGLYFNPAYGSLSLCAYPPPKGPQSPRKECDGIVSEALRPLLNESVPTLLAQWSKAFTHILLRHSSGDHFNVSAALVLPPPFPAAVESDDEGRSFAVEVGAPESQAQFIFRNGPVVGGEEVAGMAWRGMWGAGQGVESPKEDGKEGAEVWFDRVA